MFHINKLHYISQATDVITHLDAIKKSLDAGCNWIQLRIKNQTQDLVLEQAILAKKLCDSYQAKLIINDNPMVAHAVNAHGVHLGLLDMPIAEARRIVGDQLIIGGTANTFDHVKQRASEGADYVGLGPFRFTNTKQNLSPVLGLTGYQSVISKMRDEGINVPLIAIGGINAEDVLALMGVGVYGIAISGSITFAEDSRKVVETLNDSLNTEFA